MTQEYRLDLDLKDKVTIPAKLRGRLDSRLILCLAPDDKQGLYVFTTEAWQEIMEPIDSRKLTSVTLPDSVTKSGWLAFDG